MATINDFGIPGVGDGILHPKHKHRWRALFVGMAGGTSSLRLSHQLVTFKRPGLQFVGGPGGEAHGRHVSLRSRLGVPVEIQDVAGRPAPVLDE